MPPVRTVSPARAACSQAGWRCLRAVRQGGAACMLCLAANSVAAANFEIAPVIIELATGHVTDSVRITNRDEKPMSIQVRAYDWTQREGQDVLAPASALQLSPPLFTLAAGASQTVRLLGRGPAQASELAYRLLIDQIPAPDDSLAINFKFRVSMPVFFAVDGKAEPKLTWRLLTGSASVAADDGMLRPAIEVRNDGNRRAKLASLSVKLADGRNVTPVMGANPYVLATSLRRFVLPEGVVVSGPVQVSFISDAGADTLRLDGSAP